MSPNGYVKSETTEGVTRITFHHPQSNSLPGALLEKLAAAVGAGGRDANTRVILLQSEGTRAFVEKRRPQWAVLEN